MLEFWITRIVLYYMLSEAGGQESGQYTIPMNNQLHTEVNRKILDASIKKAQKFKGS